jgi:acetyl-CoA acetyltransferase
MGEAYIVAAARTAGGKRGGKLKDWHPVDLGATVINSLLDRVSGSSVAEIDRLIVDLRNVRDFLHTEGERVQREIQSYAQLSSVAMTSVKIIAESMSQWKSQVSDARLDRA